jgi:hypothetical protein
MASSIYLYFLCSRRTVHLAATKAVRGVSTAPPLCQCIVPLHSGSGHAVKPSGTVIMRISTAVWCILSEAESRAELQTGNQTVALKFLTDLTKVVVCLYVSNLVVI